MTSCQEEMRLRGHHPRFPCDILAETALLPGSANDSSAIRTRLSKSLLVFLCMLKFCVVALGAMNLHALPPLRAAPSDAHGSGRWFRSSTSISLRPGEGNTHGPNEPALCGAMVR